MTNDGQHPVNNDTLICPKHDLYNITPDTNATTSSVNQEISTFDKVWNLYSTVPVILGICMFPLLNFRSATFFTKFNSLGSHNLCDIEELKVIVFFFFCVGTMSAMYLLIFVAAKCFTWGINIPDWAVEFDMKSTFVALSGMLSLSFFIHNIIISIMKNNRHPENNVRKFKFLILFITFLSFLSG